MDFVHDTLADGRPFRVLNFSCTGWRLSGDLPMLRGETLSLTVTLPNEQRIIVPEAVVRWSRGPGAHAPGTPPITK